MKAVAMDPPLLALDRDELMRRLEILCGGAGPDLPGVVRACMVLTNIAQGWFGGSTGPSIEWDELMQMLVLPDPYLLFYLRWSVVLEREADALPSS